MFGHVIDLMTMKLTNIDDGTFSTLNVKQTNCYTGPSLSRNENGLSMDGPFSSLSSSNKLTRTGSELRHNYYKSQEDKNLA